MQKVILLLLLGVHRFDFFQTCQDQSFLMP